MSEHERDEQEEPTHDDESPEEFAEDMESDPARAGGGDEPADELRGG